VHVGTKFVGATIGQVDYSFCNFKLLVTTLPAPTGGAVRETTNLAGGERLTVGSFNVENLTDGDPDAKFTGLAQTIVNAMKAPDLITIEEVQDNDGTAGGTGSTVVAANEVYAALIAAIQMAGGPTYEYRQIDPEAHHDGGAPGGNIRVGLLFRTDRGLSFVPRTNNGLDCATGSPTPAGCATTATSVRAVAGKPELTLSPGRILDPSSDDEDTQNAFNVSRKPLVGEFLYKGRTLFVIANHFNSKGGDEALFGRNQPQNRISEAQRHKQATLVNQFVASILAVDPQAYVILGGDFNDFEFSTTMNILRTGAANGQGGAELVNLYDLLPENERYSYVFEGNTQALDHILASPAVMSGASPEYDVVHLNAEFFDQQSDHDPQVARFNVPVGQGRAEAQLMPDVVDFGDVALGATPSPTRTVVLSNTGLTPLTVSALTLDGPHAAEFAIVSPTAPFTLHAGQTQSIVVRFSPASKGPKNARLQLTDDAPGEARVALRGVGQGPEAAIAPDRVGFGRVLVNTQATPRTVTIFNTGVAPLSVTGVTVTGADASAFPLSGLPTFPATIPAGETRTFTVGFNPTQRKGYSARIEVAHNGTGELRLPLNGQGVLANEGGGAPPRPEANLSPNLVGFGDVPLGTATSPRTVMIYNTGDAPLIVNTVGVDGPAAAEYTLAPLTLPATVAPGTALSVQVRFAPTAVGQRPASLMVTDNAQGGERRVTLRGVGQGPEASVTPDRLNFGQLPVQTSLSRTAVITNSGLAPLHMTSVTISGAGAGDYQVTPAGTSTVAPGETLTLTVTCTPSTTGSRPAQLEVQDDAVRQLRVNLVCTGT
jgi:hypothetical protein